MENKYEEITSKSGKLYRLCYVYEGKYIKYIQVELYENNIWTPTDNVDGIKIEDIMNRT